MRSMTGTEQRCRSALPLELRVRRLFHGRALFVVFRFGIAVEDYLAVGEIDRLDVA